jgi:hypothetical protein
MMGNPVLAALERKIEAPTTPRHIAGFAAEHHGIKVAFDGSAPAY